METELIVKVGCIYERADGRIVGIVMGSPPVEGVEIGVNWNGIYWADSVDGKKPKIENERYTYKGKHWNYISQFSQFGGRQFNVPEFDLVKEITQ